MSYDYGPPVTAAGDPPEGTPQDNTEAVTTDEQGAVPHVPPENTAVVEEPGGSPSEESGVVAEPPVEPQPIEVQPDPVAQPLDAPPPPPVEDHWQALAPE